LRKAEAKTGKKAQKSRRELRQKIKRCYEKMGNKVADFHDKVRLKLSECDLWLHSWFAVAQFTINVLVKKNMAGGLIGYQRAVCRS
jgi:hypothetical protein